MANYIYYKGKKYGDGTDQKIKAVSMDWFLKNNFETQEEINNFIEQYNNGGFKIDQDSSGYVLVPSTDNLVIHSAILTDDATNGLIYEEEPEELDVVLDNGVQAYYTGKDKAAVVQGLRCVRGYPNSGTFRGPVYNNGSWSIQDNANFQNLVCPRRGQPSLTYEEILQKYEAAGETCPCDVISNIQHFIETGEIEKFVYTDFLLYNSQLNYKTVFYNTIVYQGITSQNQFQYSPYYFDYTTDKYIKNAFNGGGSSDTQSFVTDTQPLVFGYIPCVCTEQFSEDKNIYKIPSEYTRETRQKDGKTYYCFNNGLGDYYSGNNADAANYEINFYFDEQDENKNGMYQKYYKADESLPTLWRYIGPTKNFFGLSYTTARDKIYFVPIALIRDENNGYKQIKMNSSNSSGSSSTIQSADLQQTLEESAFNQAISNRTEPKNWLEMKENLGVP